MIVGTVRSVVITFRYYSGRINTARCARDRRPKNERTVRPSPRLYIYILRSALESPNDVFLASKRVSHFLKCQLRDCRLAGLLPENPKQS
jgi:hypothetical protein